MKATAMAAAKAIGGVAILLGAMVLTGCSGGPAGPDTAADRTAAGIRVIGAGSELYPVVDERWAEVENCWAMQAGADRVSVTIQAAELRDKMGQGVIRVNGQLVYGMRLGNQVWVAPDLAALRHEFSHLIGEKATGHLVNDGDGRCWL